MRVLLHRVEEFGALHGVSKLEVVARGIIRGFEIWGIQCQLLEGSNRHDHIGGAIRIQEPQ